MRPAELWWSPEADASDRQTKALGFAEHLAKSYLSGQRSAEAEAIRLYEGESDAERGKSALVTATNTILSAVDAQVADLTRQRVRIQWATYGGSRDEQDRAQLQSRAIDGQFDDAQIYGDVGVDWARDGFVCPLGGAVKVTPDYGSSRVLIERVRSSSLLADPRDSLLGMPRSRVFAETIAPEVLAAQFPEKGKEIFELQCVTDEFEYEYWHAARATPELQQRVWYYDCYHLPSCAVDTSDDAQWGIGDGKIKHDGRHVLVCPGPPGGLVLVDEPWPLDAFPYVVFRPIRRMRGPEADTIPRRLGNTQRWIDKMQFRIDGMMDLYSRVILAVKKGVKTKALDNDWSRLLEIPANMDVREALVHLLPATAPPDLVARVERAIQWTREFMGRSEFSSIGQKPSGVNSGKALREVLDQDTSRQSSIFRAWESSHIELAKVTIEMNRLLAARDPSFGVSFFGDDQDLAEERWRRIDLPNSRFRLRPWPTNYFSQSPGARSEQVQELVDRQFLPTEVAVNAMASEYSDLKAMLARQNAAKNNIERKLNSVVREREVNDSNLPHGLMDLAAAEEAVISRYNEEEAGNADSEVLRALGQWLEALKQVQQKSAPPPPPPGPTLAPEQMLPGGAPGMAGAPEPVPGAVAGGIPIPGAPQVM